MRDQFNAFVDRHDIAWELAMAFLAIVYVAIGFALDDASAPLPPILEATETALTIIFAVEFSSRFLASRHRGQYLRGHWIDLVALIPATRGLRIARLLRLLRLVRTFAGVYRALGHATRLANHRGLATIVVSWLAVMVICCAAIYAVEHEVNEAFATPFDALWWGIVTLTTVGYGDVYPITDEGRIAAGALMILGIGLFSAVTAIVTSYVLTKPDSVAADPILTIERLGALARDGVITPTEYESKRIELLARI
jgi:voltage-gated potassium channel